MTSPSSFPAKTSALSTVNISTTTLNDGSSAVNHVLVDPTAPTGVVGIVPASKSDIASVVSAIEALTGQTIVLTDAFGVPATGSAASATDLFGNNLGLS